MNHDVIHLMMLKVRMLLMVRQACKCLTCCQSVHLQKHNLHQIALRPYYPSAFEGLIHRGPSLESPFLTSVDYKLAVPMHTFLP